MHHSNSDSFRLAGMPTLTLKKCLCDKGSKSTKQVAFAVNDERLFDEARDWHIDLIDIVRICDQSGSTGTELVSLCGDPYPLTKSAGHYLLMV